MLIDLEEMIEWLKDNADAGFQCDSLSDPCNPSYYYNTDWMLKKLRREWVDKEKWAGMKDYREQAIIERDAPAHTHVKLEYNFTVSFNENIEELSKLITAAVDGVLKENEVKA